jgi:hypothetical protein
MSKFASPMTSDGDSDAKGCSPWRDTQLRNFLPQEGRAVKGTSPLCGARQSDRNRKSCDAATKQVTVRHGHTVVHAHIDSLELVVLSLQKAQLASNPYTPYNQRSAAAPHGPGAPALDLAAHDLAEVALQVQRLIADKLGTHCGSLRDAAFKLRKTRGVTSCLAKKLAQLNAATSLLRHSSSQWTANLMSDVEAALDSTTGKAVTSPGAGDENTNSSTCADTQSDAAEVATVLTSGQAISGNNSTCADTQSDAPEVASVSFSGQATSGFNNSQLGAAEVTSVSTSGQPTAAQRRLAKRAKEAKHTSTFPDTQSDAVKVSAVTKPGAASNIQLPNEPNTVDHSKSKSSSHSPQGPVSDQGSPTSPTSGQVAKSKSSSQSTPSLGPVSGQVEVAQMPKAIRKELKQLYKDHTATRKELIEKREGLAATGKEVSRLVEVTRSLEATQKKLAK